MKRFRFRMIIPAYPDSGNIYSHVARRTTTLGAIVIATIVSRLLGWEVEIVDENNCSHRSRRKSRFGHFCPKDKFGRPDHLKLQEMRPADVVGFYGSLSSTIPRLFEVAALYKSLGVKTIAGGSHVSNLPEEALSNNIDVVAYAYHEKIDGVEVANSGDGEEIIKELLSAWQNAGTINHVKGVAYLDKDGQMVKTEKRPPITDFSAYPFPDFGLLMYAKVKIFPVSWWRGCPFNCEFCAVKGKPRCSPAERLFENIVYLVENFGATKFFLVDDQVGGNHQLTDDIQETIKAFELIAGYEKETGIRLSFTVQIRLSGSDHLDLLKAMRKAGVDNVCIGYESPIDEDLKAMRKGLLAKDMIDRTLVFHRLGFNIHGMFIIFYPRKKDEPKTKLAVDDVVRIYRRFIKDAKIRTVQVLFTIPLPGTELRDRLMAEGRIYPLSQIGWKFYDGQYPIIPPDDGALPEEYQRAVIRIMAGFYNPVHLVKIIDSFLRFMVIVPPSVLTLPTLKVRYITTSFRVWRRKFFQTSAIRFGGSLIVRNWLKKYAEGDFPARLRAAEAELKKQNNNLGS
ncbi:MAG: radical SAM protein [Patescibacteria group bacterium]